MNFGKRIDTYIATSVITYKFICFGGTAYTIMKHDVVHDSIYYICRNIRNKDAAFMIWQDVKNGIQK